MNLNHVCKYKQFKTFGVKFKAGINRQEWKCVLLSWPATWSRSHFARYFVKPFVRTFHNTRRRKATTQPSTNPSEAFHVQTLQRWKPRERRGHFPPPRRRFISPPREQSESEQSLRVPARRPSPRCRRPLLFSCYGCNSSIPAAAGRAAAAAGVVSRVLKPIGPQSIAAEWEGQPGKVTARHGS